MNLEHLVTPECKEVLKKKKKPTKNTGDSHWRILIRFPLDKSKIITEAK